MSLRTFSKDELATLLEKHAKWLKNEYGGERADLSRSNLSGSNLSGSDLRWSDFSGSDLSGSDLRWSNLSRSDFSGSNLSGSDLRWSDFSGSNLSRSDLRWSNLSRSDFSGSNLSGSDLSGSDLSWSDLKLSDLKWSNLSRSDFSGSNLSGSDLSGSNLSRSIGSELAIARTRTIPSEGSIVGWKKCTHGVLVKIKVPDDARRSNAFGRKCRAEFVDVLKVVNAEFGISIHDGKTRYESGKRVTCDKWCEDWMQECAEGIHFYITREEAEAHS